MMSSKNGLLKGPQISIVCELDEVLTQYRDCYFSSSCHRTRSGITKASGG